jgi:hypothetical protein
VHPDVIETTKESYDKYDCLVEEDGKMFVLTGPIAIASHQCNSPLELCMSDEWLRGLDSALRKKMGPVMLKVRDGYKWQLKSEADKPSGVHTNQRAGNKRKRRNGYADQK